jgi:hypothetical protein
VTSRVVLSSMELVLISKSFHCVDKSNFTKYEERIGIFAGIVSDREA